MYLLPSTVVTNLDGDPIKVVSKEGEAGEPLTLGAVITTALTVNLPDEKPDKAGWLDDFELAGRFHKIDLPVKVSTKELERIRSLVLKLPYNKLAVARVLFLLANSSATLEPHINPHAQGAANDQAA